MLGLHIGFSYIARGDNVLEESVHLATRGQFNSKYQEALGRTQS